MDIYKTFKEPEAKTVKDVAADRFIEKYAKFLKNSTEFKTPSWALYVKTSVSKELAPYDSDWMYYRAAAVMRHIYIRPNVGVGTLQKCFSSKYRRGTQPSCTQKASGKIIRHILMECEKLDLLSAGTDGGRQLSSAGRKQMDHIASQITRA